MVLRRALGDRAGQPVYVHGERGFGYRLFGPVTRLDGDETTVATRRRQVSVLVGVAVVVAAGVMLGLRAWLPAVAAEGRARPLTVAVRPQLGVTGEAQPLARELANSIASGLRGVRGVRVVRWGGIGGKPRLWLEGACQETAKGLELQVQIVDGARGAVWVHRVQGDAQEILGQEAAIVAAVTRAVRARAEPVAAAPGEADVSPQLRRLCVRGSLWWLSWTSGGLRAAAKAWAEAIAIAPGHAPAHAGLSLTRSVESLLGYVAPSQAESSARDHARRALELDPALLEAHLATGLVRLVFDRDAAGARGAMREAAEAFPEDPESAMVRAVVAQAQGRVEESLQLLSRATDTDPHATGAFYLEGRSLQMEADWTGAAAAYRKALDLEPALVLARRRLAECLAADHREAEALATLDARASRPGEAPRGDAANAVAPRLLLAGARPRGEAAGVRALWRARGGGRRSGGWREGRPAVSRVRASRASPRSPAGVLYRAAPTWTESRYFVSQCTLTTTKRSSAGHSSLRCDFQRGMVRWGFGPSIPVMWLATWRGLKDPSRAAIRARSGPATWPLSTGLPFTSTPQAPWHPTQ